MSLWLLSGEVGEVRQKQGIGAVAQVRGRGTSDRVIDVGLGQMWCPFFTASQPGYPGSQAQ